ncbi:MAG TPA: amino acid permease [Dehalococcoidia bacterium]|nr:amino acid permease [Dehalococcoidia bacterium]
MTAAVGERFGDVLATVALLATGNTLLMMLATGARMTYGMSTRGLLPRVFRTVGERRRTPWVAALTIATGAGAISLFGDIGFIAQITNFAVFAAFIVVNATLIRLRRTRPDAPRPFRIRWLPGNVPVSVVLGALGAAALSISMDLEALAGGAAVVAIGLAVSVVAIGQEEVGDDVAEGESA